MPDFGDFWRQFLQNFAATLLGVAIGIPVAFWWDRFQHRRRQADELERLRIALLTIVDAIDVNTKTFHAVLAEIVEKPFYAPDLDVARWAAVQGEVIAHMRDPELQGDLAHYFERVAAFREANRLYAMAETNGTASDRSKKDIRGAIVWLAHELLKQTADLERRLREWAPNRK
jgi:hypothetical protein